MPREIGTTHLDKTNSQSFQFIFTVFPPATTFVRLYNYWVNELFFYVNFHKKYRYIANIIRAKSEKYIKSTVKDPELAEKLTPTYDLGCKRITPNDYYLKVS